MNGKRTKKANEAPTMNRIENAATNGYTDCFSLALMAGSTNLYISYASTGILVANPNTADPTTMSSRGVVTVPPISMYCDGSSRVLIVPRIAVISGWYIWKGFCKKERSDGTTR